MNTCPTIAFLHHPDARSPNGRRGRRVAVMSETAALGLLWLAACGGPAPPQTLLKLPDDYPATWKGHSLYHTPNAFIYAPDDFSAGEADRWVADVRRYVSKCFQGDLGKGVVIVLGPGDEAFAQTIEQQLALERDSEVMVTPPRKPETASEIRRRMRKEGIPEGPTVHAAAVPLTPQKLAEMGLRIHAPVWAVGAPSHERCADSGAEVMIAAFHKKQPKADEKKIRQVMSTNTYARNLGAKPFEVNRAPVLFGLWAQKQKDWSDDRRREEIRRFIKQTLRSNGLPVPKDEDLEW